MGDLQPGDQRLGRGLDELAEGLLREVHEALRSLLALYPTQHLRVVAGLRHSLCVLDHVVGGLSDHIADHIKAGTSGPTGDLVELAGPQHPLLAAVELRKAREHHRADRHVDADAKGVRAADHAQQAALGQRLHESPVAGEHAGMVHGDARVQQLGERLAETGGEPEPLHRLDELAAVRAVGDAGTQQGGSALHGGRLGGVDDVDRRLGVAQQQLHGLLQRAQRPRVGQRHRPDGVADDARAATRPP